MQHFFQGVILNMLFILYWLKFNHIGHFIKIQFVNKGIEIINSPSIYCKDISAISSIRTYFENKESPMICYKYNKPIHSTTKVVPKFLLQGYYHCNQQHKMPEKCIK